MTTTDRPSRLEQAATQPLTPGSLVGSFFLTGADPGWQGCVVAEPSPGTYLVQTFSWLGDDYYDQRLIPIADMAGWTFYDTPEWMTSSYEHHVSRRWEQERQKPDSERETQ